MRKAGNRPVTVCVEELEGDALMVVSINDNITITRDGYEGNYVKMGSFVQIEDGVTTMTIFLEEV